MTSPLVSVGSGQALAAGSCLRGCAAGADSGGSRTAAGLDTFPSLPWPLAIFPDVHLEWDTVVPRHKHGVSRACRQRASPATLGWMLGFLEPFTPHKPSSLSYIRKERGLAAPHTHKDLPPPAGLFHKMQPGCSAMPFLTPLGVPSSLS